MGSFSSSLFHHQYTCTVGTSRAESPLVWDHLMLLPQLDTGMHLVRQCPTTEARLRHQVDRWPECIGERKSMDFAPSGLPSFGKYCQQVKSLVLLWQPWPSHLPSSFICQSLSWLLSLIDLPPGLCHVRDRTDFYFQMARLLDCPHMHNNIDKTWFIVPGFKANWIPVGGSATESISN